MCFRFAPMRVTFFSCLIMVCKPKVHIPLLFGVLLYDIVHLFFYRFVTKVKNNEFPHKNNAYRLATSFQQRFLT